jgi:hypothetical protein
MPLSKAQATHAQLGALDGMDRAGCLTAAALYERYLDAVYGYVVQRVPTIEEAEDVTAEVFAAAAAGLPRFRGQCPPYLYPGPIRAREQATGVRDGDLSRRRGGCGPQAPRTIADSWSRAVNPAGRRSNKPIRIVAVLSRCDTLWSETVTGAERPGSR